MLSGYQLKRADLFNIFIDNVTKLVIFIDKEKYVIHYEKFKLYLRLKLKLKNMYRLLEFNKSQWLKQCVEFNTQKRKKVE